MKLMYKIRGLLVIALLTNSLLAQAPDLSVNIFDKDGLRFAYPDDWTLTDKSTPELQNLLLTRANSQLLISIVSPRAVIRGYDQFREMQYDINDRFIIAIKQGLTAAEHTTKEDPVCLNFNGRDVTGMRYSGYYRSEPSTGDVFPFVLGDRFVDLVYMRSDK